jgi:predicted dehydrogenase
VRQTQGAKVEGVFTHLAELLEQPRLAFVIAALRNDLGPGVCAQVIDAGKPIMAEKPIGRTAPDVERVARAAEQAGVVLSVCYQNRYHPCAVEARDLVRAGMIGPVTTLETRLLTTQVRFRNPQHWLFTQQYAGGGILSWLGCHHIDMLRYVSGDEVVAVSAEVNTMSGEAIDVEDVATLALRFRSGAIGAVHCAYVLALSGSGYHGSGYDSYMAFRGPAGRVYWDPTERRAPRLHAESTRPAWQAAPIRQFEYQPAESPAYGGAHGEAFMRDFIRACRGEIAPPTTGRDALAVARIVDAAYESSRTGRRVEIAPVDG